MVVTRKIFVVLVLLAASLPAASAQRLAGTRLFVPVAGEIPSASGGQFETDLQLTNFAQERTAVTIELVPTGIGAARQPSLTVSLEPMEMRFIANVTHFFTREKRVGGLIITAPRPIAAAAFVRHRNPDGWSDEEHRALFEAIPAELSIRHGQSASLVGVRPRYNVFAFETSGRHVELLFEALGANGKVEATQKVAIPGHTHVIVNITAMAPHLRDGRVRCSVVDGDGAVIVAGSHSDPGSMVSKPYRMSFGHADFALPRREKVAYATLLLFAIVCAALAGYSRLSGHF